MPLISDKVLLRRPCEADIEARLSWYANPEVTRYLPLAGKSALPRDAVAAYIAQVSSSERPVLDYSIDSMDGRTIGACSLRDFDKANRAEISVIIGDPMAWGKGYAAQAMRLLITHGFAELGLHAIWLVVRSDNRPAVQLYEHLGFRHDGTIRASALVDGVRYDKYLMSIQSSEWPNPILQYRSEQWIPSRVAGQ